MQAQVGQKVWWHQPFQQTSVTLGGRQEGGLAAAVSNAAVVVVDGRCSSRGLQLRHARKRLTRAGRAGS